MSFVLRVISEAVENLFISAFENPTTLVNVFSLKSRPMPAPTLDAANPTATAARSMATAKINILPPIFQRYWICISSMSIPAFLSHETAYATPIDLSVVVPTESILS